MSLRTDRAYSIGIFLVGLLIGGIIFANLLPIGIGVSTDGATYLMAAHNFTDGRGFLSYNDEPMTWWPPLYPALMGALHWLTGVDLLVIAFWLNVVTFVATVAVTQLLAAKLFPGRPVLVLWAVLMAAGTHVMVAPVQNVGTDYLAAFLALPALFFAGRYIQRPTLAPWIGMFVFGLLSVLQRYNGVTVIAMAGLVVFFATPGAFWRKAAWTAGQGLAAFPLVLWGLRNVAMGTGPFGYRVPPLNSLDRNIYLTFRVLLRWLVPDWVFEPHQLRTQVAFGAFLLVVVLVLAAGFFWYARRKRGEVTPFAIPVVTYSFVFVAALIANASVTYFKDITERFLVPVYIPLILTGLIALDFLLQAARARLPRRWLPAALVILLLVVPAAANWNGLEQTIHQVEVSRVQGVEPDNLYVNRAWQENPAVARVVALSEQYPQAVFYSNRPAGIAIYTWGPAYWSPVKYDPVFKYPHYPLAKYETAFPRCTDACYLVWLLPHPYEHLYLPATLKWMVNLEEVFVSDGGIIYHIGPRSFEAAID